MNTDGDNRDYIAWNERTMLYWDGLYFRATEERHARQLTDIQVLLLKCVYNNVRSKLASNY